MSQTYLTAADVAERLKVSKSSAYRIMKQCMAVYLPGGIRVTEAELERYLAARTRREWSAPEGKRDIKPVKRGRRRRGQSNEELPDWVRVAKPKR
jgi:hypothetical protein